jgi:hypothetical protein
MINFFKIKLVSTVLVTIQKLHLKLVEPEVVDLPILYFFVKPKTSFENMTKMLYISSKVTTAIV